MYEGKVQPRFLVRKP